MIDITMLSGLDDKIAIVTGAAGFIGSHLCDKILACGGHVLGIDNLLTGDRENINRLRRHPRFQFIFGDIRNVIDIHDMRLANEVSYILHFASPASPADYLAYPVETLEVGSTGTQNLLKLAMKAGARFLLASTSEVYGDPLEHPQKESYWGNVNPVGPRGVYDEAKRYAEAITMAYHRYHKVNTVIARIFNTYGPRMRPNDGRAIPAFISSALRNEIVNVYGSGEQTRSFCYIDDTINGLLKLLLSEECGPINIGNPAEWTVQDCAKLVIKLCNSTSSITHQSLPVDDPKVRCPDINFAQKKLSWSPKVSLEDGLRKTIDYFKSINLPINHTEKVVV